MTDNSPATSEELDKAQKEVIDDIRHLKNLNKTLLIVVFIALAIMSITSIITVRVSTTSQSVSKQNRAFLQNFSDYMRCLVVTDKEAVQAYGLESYFNLCDDLLFRNTGLAPLHTKITIPSTTTTTGVTVVS